MTRTERDARRIFTIGHSDHSADQFLSLLIAHGVTAVADVRSQPYSRYSPQFNRDTLASCLKRANIGYVFLGLELGARRVEAEAYCGAQAKYERIRQLPAYNEGLSRLRNGSTSQRIALVCAEKDPLTCHRSILVCRSLRHDPIEIVHILADGSLESQVDAETRLLRLVGLPVRDLFRNREELVEQAYEIQAGQIEYVATDSPAQREQGLF